MDCGIIVHTPVHRTRTHSVAHLSASTVTTGYTSCVNTYAAVSTTPGLTKVTTLDHEALDDTVELGALVAHAFRESGTILLDTSRESAEVLHGFGDGLLTPCKFLNLDITVTL